MSKVVQNLAGSWSKSDIVGIDNQDTVNFLVEESTNDRAVTKYLRSIPGSDAYITGEECRAMRVVNDKLFAVLGDHLGVIEDDNFVPILICSGATVRMTNTGYPEPWLIIVDGTSMWALNTTWTTQEMRAKYKTIELPPDSTPNDVAYLYGHVLMLSYSNDKIYYTGQYLWDKTWEFAGWTPDDIFWLHVTNDSGELIAPDGHYFAAEFAPDKTLRLLEGKNMVIAVGERTMQCFTYTGEAFIDGQPFSTTDNTAADFGGVVATVMQGVAYAYGEKGVYSYNGTNVVKVSSADMDRYLAKHAPVDATYIRIDEHCLAIFQFEDCTFAFDGNWVRLSSNNQGRDAKWRYTCGAYMNGETYLGHSTGIAKVNLNKFTEHDGNPIRRMRRGQIWTRSGQNISLEELRFIVNVGQTSRLVTDGVMHVSVCRDGATIETIKEMKLPTTGNYKKRLSLYKLGIGPRWDVKVEISDDCPFALMAAETDFEDVIGYGV